MTVEGEFSRALRRSFDDPEVLNRIRRVKSTVAEQIQRTDASANIKYTDFFNNSFAPDLVARWPKENKSRSIFLRSTDDPGELQEDLDILAGEAPIFYSLDNSVLSPTREVARDLEALHGALDQSRAMLTGPDGLETLALGQAERPVQRLLSQALIRGGRGLVDETAAQAAVTATTEGFAGAAAVNRETTETATRLLSGVLDESQSGRLSRMLQSIWVGAGGSVTAFPGKDLVSGPLTSDDLQYLIENLESASLEFWRSLARGVETERLAELQFADFSKNFHDIVVSSADLLFGKAIQVEQSQAWLGEEYEDPKWTTAQGCLALRGNGWISYVAPRSRDELPNIHEVEAGLDVREVLERADRIGARVRDVQLRGSKSSVTWQAYGEASIGEDEDFERFAEGSHSIAERATVTSEGVRFSCDFTRRVASGNTSALFTLVQICQTALPVLQRLDDQELEAVHLAVRPPRAEPISLWSDDFWRPQP